MMHIQTMGIDAVEAYVPAENEACVSIHFADGDGWDHGRAQAKLSPRFREVLRVAFDDCIAKDHRLHGVVELNVFQALAIVSFVAAQRVAARDLVIHCGAGMSRSVAIAAALDDRRVGEWQNRRNVINPTVYELIMGAINHAG